MIGQSGLGYSFDPLTEDSVPHPYGTAAKLFMYDYSPQITAVLSGNHASPTLFKMMFSQTYFLPISLKIGTPKFRRFIMDILPWKNLHAMRDIVDTLHNVSVEIFGAKKKAPEEGDETVTQQIGQGKDIMSILSAYRLLL